MNSTPSSPRMETSPKAPTFILSLMRRPRLEAAAAIAATRLGSAPFESECAIGSPSLDASKTPFSSGIALRSASIWAFNASPLAIACLLGLTLSCEIFALAAADPGAITLESILSAGKAGTLAPEHTKGGRAGIGESPDHWLRPFLLDG